MNARVVLCAALAACTSNGPATIELAPADLTVRIENGAAVVQSYTATLVDADGRRHDITDTARFTVSDGHYGGFSGASLQVTGQAAGPVQVRASTGVVTGETNLFVFVKDTIVEPGVPATAPDAFDAAQENAARAPAIVYPADQILVPPNLGQLDVQWKGNPSTTDDLFRVALSNDYVDVQIYTAGIDPQAPAIKFRTIVPPTLWTTIASARTQLAFTVSATSSIAPTVKGTTAPQTIDVTNETARGGVYYWTIDPTSTAIGIDRYDISRPDVPPAPLFQPASSPSPCMGCHALSRDGTKIAMTLDNPDMRATVLEVGNRGQLVRYDQPTTTNWNFATFTADGNKLVTVLAGTMTLRDTHGGAALATLANSPGMFATHPELAPDNSALVSVEAPAMPMPYVDLFSSNGSLVVRSYDDATNTFGPITTLLPYAPMQANFYPSYSPDGQWIVFTRTTGQSYDDLTAETWVIKADGSMPPIQLAKSNSTGALTNSWARWVPFAQTFGPDKRPLFYLSFSSTRPFGVQLPTGGRPQIWMAPFFPDLALAGMDPSGPAFRLPFQNVAAGNHVAQWAQSVVLTSGGSTW